MSTRHFASLEEKLAFQIDQQGPISLAAFMHACLADPQFGYYTTRPGIGEEADFITAPEISQMFGELIGGWCAAAWQQLGRPDPFCLAELGPGTGTLMADLLRAASRAEGFMEAAQLVLVEMSPVMRERQETVLQPWKEQLAGLEWIDHVSALPQIPLIAIANEFLDALPIRQYVKSQNGWREAGVGLNEDGKLIRITLPSLADPALLPEGADTEPDGAVFEHAPAREAAVGEITAHLLQYQGAALLIDYGHSDSGFGDTFQAMRGHAYVDPFAGPGLHDLTSHVDFGRLIATAKAAGLPQAALNNPGRFPARTGIAGARRHARAWQGHCDPGKPEPAGRAPGRSRSDGNPVQGAAPYQPAAPTPGP